MPDFIDGFPRWARVRQTFPGQPVADFAAAVAEVCRRLRLADKVRPGQRVAITSGSRGVANVVAVTAAVAAEVRRLGGEPWVLPCMGSHGGATPEGQLAVLHGYGVTDAAIGAPVLSQGEVVPVGHTSSGVPLWCDKLAFESDHIVVINRVKPHTDFSGVIESGPTKMLAIGLGKHHSAGECHRRGVERGYEAVIREVGDALWERLPVAGGIGLVENGYHQTVAVGAVRPEAHEADEAALLEQAREVFGYLPFEQLHVLLVDEIGKDISGAGMDPNVTGQDFCKTHSRRSRPFIWRIGVRGLTAATHGNATGLGHADFALQRCVEAVDWKATATNVITAASPEGGKCPLVMPDDVTLLRAAFATAGSCPPAEMRLVRIENTLRLDVFLAAEALLDEVRAHPRCEVVDEPWGIGFEGGMFVDRVR